MRYRSLAFTNATLASLMCFGPLRLYVLKSRVYQNNNCLSTHKRAHYDLHIIDFELRTKLITVVLSS